MRYPRRTTPHAAVQRPPADVAAQPVGDRDHGGNGGARRRRRGAEPEGRPLHVPPGCGKPPTGTPVMALPRYTSADGAFSVSYPSRIGLHR